MNISHHFYPVLGIFTLLTAASLSAVHRAAVPPSGTQQVVVSNTASNPVPTAAQGTTQVAGTVGLASNAVVGLASGASVGVSSLPAVQLAAGQTVGLSSGTSVAVSSLPAVQLASGQSVAINGNVSLANDANNPLPVQDTAVSRRMPVQVQVGDLSFADGSFNAATVQGFNGYTVPTGYRLVIESISANAALPAGQRIVDAGVGLNELHFNDNGTDIYGRERFDASCFVRGYVAQNASVGVGAERDSVSGTGSVNIWVIGYLEPTS